MSFLIRRNLPRAWAGWFDSFDKYGVGALKQPWVHLGDGTPADINNLDELHIPTNYLTSNGGGESYAYQPFTPNWGVEFEMWFPVEGLASQSFSIFFTDSWTTIGAAFINAIGFRFIHAPAVAADAVRCYTFANIWTVGTELGAWLSPVAYFGSTITVRVLCEADEHLMIWVNDVYLGAVMIPPGYKLGPGRRCVRFMNAALCDVWMRWVYHYDRPSSIPPKTVWQSDFYDDFNGRSGNQDGINGWTQYGSAAAVVGDSWSITGTADVGAGLLRNTANSSGRMRIEATIGGNVAPNSTSSAVLVLSANASGTEGLSASIFGDRLIVNRFTGSIETPTYTVMQEISTSFGVAVASGDKIAFSTYNGYGWVEVNGVPKIYVGRMHSVVPSTNTYAGLRVLRSSGVNGASWNDVRIYSGLG